MGNAGSPYALFVRTLRRAGETGRGADDAVAAALDLRSPLTLADGLALLLVCARAGEPRWERMAVRWAARYLQEARPSPDAAEARLVLSAVQALGSPSAPAAVETLHALADARGLDRVVRALEGYEPRPRA